MADLKKKSKRDRKISRA